LEVVNGFTQAVMVNVLVKSNEGNAIELPEPLNVNFPPLPEEYVTLVIVPVVEVVPILETLVPEPE
jgi:hypothetical protein